MVAAYVVTLLFVVAYAQGLQLTAEPAIIEDIRDGGPMVRRPGSDDGILDKSRELFKSHMLFYVDDTIMGPTVTVAQPTAARIVAGLPAVEGQIPFQVSIRMVNRTGSVFSCGGSIIDNKWILTAAHCLANRDSFVVRFGVTNLTRPEIIVETTHKYIHPEYDEIRAGVQTADLALLGLDHYIPYSANVQPIRLMSRAQKNINFEGVTMIVSGFGRTDDLWNGGAASEILLWVYQRGVSNEECLRWYPTSQVIKEQTICAGYYDNPSQSSCQGDSGGPLTIVDADGERTEVGIVSFGSNAGCNSPFPSGYVRPGHYHDWFTEVTGINFDWDSDAIVPSSSESSSDEGAVNSLPSEEYDVSHAVADGVRVVEY